MSDPTDTPIDRVPLSPPRLGATGDIPGLPPLPALPKPSAPAPAAPKPAAVEKAADPAPSETAAPAVPPPPQPRWVREAVLDLVRPNRKKGLVLAAAASLVAGATAMNAIFSVPDRSTEPTGKEVAIRPTPEPESKAGPPASPPPEPVASAQEPAPAGSGAVPPLPSYIPGPAEPLAPIPAPVLPGVAVGAIPGTGSGTLPPIPAPALPGTGTIELAAAPSVAPVTGGRLPPVVVAEPSAPAILPASITAAAAPASSPPQTETLPRVLPPVLPAAGSEPVTPTPSPTTPAVSAPAAALPVPQLPAGGGVPAPTIPDLTKTDLSKSGATPGLPPAAAQNLPSPATSPAAPEKPKTEVGLTGSATPAPASGLAAPNLTPLPTDATIQPIPKKDPNALVVTPEGVTPAQQPATPSPTPPAPAPTAVQTPADSGTTAGAGAVLPAPLPTTPRPAVGAFTELPPAPATTPSAAPAREPSPAPAPAAETVSLTKPPGTADVRPVPQTSSEPPQTDFDVDVYTPKPGDTYESISQRHYGDARYAGALRAFNRGLDLGRGAPVQVPPMYVLRQRYAQYVGAPSASAAEPARGVTWEPTAGWRDGGIDRASYAGPRDGMTLWDVAEDVYRDRQEWRRVWDANPRLDPNARLAAGTRLTLPSDARASR